MALPTAIWTCVESEQINGSPEIDSRDVLYQAGLRWLVLAFRFYGLRIDHDIIKTTGKSAINLWIAGFITLFTSAMSLTVLVINATPLFSIAITIQRICYLFSSLSMIACVPAIYIHTCITFRRFRQFIQDLASCVNGITPLSRRASCVAKIKKTVRTAGIFHINFLIIIIVASRLHLANGRNDDFSTGPQWIDILIMGIWFLVGVSFINFCMCFVLLTCKILVLCFDSYIPNAKDQTEFSPKVHQITLGEQMMRHQRLSSLVKRANDVFSFYMIVTLFTDIFVIITYCKIHSSSFEQERILADISTILVFFLYMTQLVLKIVFCSQLNEKVVSSLELSVMPESLSDVQSYTGEHINYILYQNQQSTNSATITYGGFFAVKKEFLFTVAGLIFSYVLILKDMSVV